MQNDPRNDYYLGPNPTMHPREWWESLRPFFQEKGYTLYQTDYHISDLNFYWELPSSVFSEETHFPYAYIGGCEFCEDECDLKIITSETHPRVVFAQDAQSRHVCIKVLRPKYDELKILELLYQQRNLLEKEDFPGVTPVLDLFNKDEHHFAVFPRWEGSFKETLPWFNNMGEILDYIGFLLKGLTFLHDHRIFHRDLNYTNFLTNHFACSVHREENVLRQNLRSERKLIYSLNDFDLSLLLPADTDIKTCRLPIKASYPGSIDKPYGVVHGELDFNPFALDVGCLGIVLAVKFDHLCSTLPILAPLLDGMLTSDTEARFTAKDAFDFFTQNRPLVADYEQLQGPMNHCAFDWQYADRWEGISPDLQQIWGKYKGRHPSAFMQHIVYPLCQREWGLDLVDFVRRLFLPFHFLKSIIGSISGLRI